MTEKIAPKFDLNDAEVEARLLQSLESVGVTPVPDEPAWQQVAHEVHRLGPTEERPTAEYARGSGINSIPPWETPPEPGTFHQEDFEFRDGRPHLVDSANVSVREDSVESLIHRAVLDIFVINFDSDDLPEWAAEDYRLRLLMEVAKLFSEFDEHMCETYGPDYLSRVDLAEASLILRSMFEAFRGMDLTSPEAIAMDLLAIGIEGLPRVGSELQRMQPKLRLPDCGITAMVELTEEIQRHLVDLPVTDDKPELTGESVTIFHDLYAAVPRLTCNGKVFDLTPRGHRLLLLLLNARDEKYFVSYKTILENWPSRTKKDGTPAKRGSNPRNKFSGLRKELNEAIRKDLGITCEPIAIVPGKGLSLNSTDVIWREHKPRHHQRQASIVRTAKALGGKAVGEVTDDDGAAMLGGVEKLSRRDFATLKEHLLEKGAEFLDKRNRPSGG